MGKILSFEEIVKTVKPIADKYKIQAIYLFGSYARKEQTEESDLDFLVYGGEDFKLTRILSLAEELRKELKKDVDVFEIREVNRNSDLYKTIMKEKVLVGEFFEPEKGV